jgi:hypothetical protein
MIVLVCGGRNYSDRARVFRELDRLESERGRIRGLIHGLATGADALARAWQAERIRRDNDECTANRRRDAVRRPGVRYHSDLWMVGCQAAWRDLETPPVALRYRRDGTAYNAAAGGRRNQFMLSWKPSFVVAFPGKNGTADMCRRANSAGLEVIEVR